MNTIIEFDKNVKLENTNQTFHPDVVVKCTEQFYLNDHTINLFALLEQLDESLSIQVFDVLDSLVEMGKLECELIGSENSPIQPVYKKIG